MLCHVHFFCLVFILYSVFLSSLANASDIDLSAPMDKGGWKLIWSEEFDYTGFPDSTKWSYDTEGNVYQWGNNEAQYYTFGRKENALGIGWGVEDYGLERTDGRSFIYIGSPDYERKRGLVVRTF